MQKKLDISIFFQCFLRLFDDITEMMKSLILDCEEWVDILLIYAKLMLVNGGDLNNKNSTHIIHYLKRI